MTPLRSPPRGRRDAVADGRSGLCRRSRHPSHLCRHCRRWGMTTTTAPLRPPPRGRRDAAAFAATTGIRPSFAAASRSGGGGRRGRHSDRRRGDAGTRSPMDAAAFAAASSIHPAFATAASSGGGRRRQFQCRHFERRRGEAGTRSLMDAAAAPPQPATFGPAMVGVVASRCCPNSDKESIGFCSKTGTIVGPYYLKHIIKM